MRGTLALGLAASMTVAVPAGVFAHGLWIDGQCVSLDLGRPCESAMQCACGHVCIDTCHPPGVLCCHQGDTTRCPPIRHGGRAVFQFATPEPCRCIGRSNTDAEACEKLPRADWNHWDFDGDGIPNKDDNCQCVPNHDQRDLDCDGIGRACEDPCDTPKLGGIDPDTLGPDCVPRDLDPVDEDGDGLGERSVIVSNDGSACEGCDPCPANPDNVCGPDAGADADTDVDTDGTEGPGIEIRGGGGCGCRTPGAFTAHPATLVLVLVPVLVLGARRPRC